MPCLLLKSGVLNLGQLAHEMDYGILTNEKVVKGSFMVIKGSFMVINYIRTIDAFMK